LIADDSAMMRKMLKKILESDPDIEVIAAARDGLDVVQKARELRPDVITMDVNMPGQDGITALQYIVNDKICPVVMVSSLTQEGALTTFEALELGAFDFVAKPGGTVSSNMETVTPN
jgi:two-component system chemotaxis response regulator CheB